MKIYKVKNGETFASIAKRFNLSAEVIKKENGFNQEVFEGARLIISDTGLSHRVKPFEKISDIATFYNVSVNKLMEINHMTKPYVFAGQTLVIPV